MLLCLQYPFSKESVEALLDQITTNGIIVAGMPLRNELPDRDNEPFLEVALAGVLYGHREHEAFSKEKRQSVPVLSPSEFVDSLRKR